MSTAEYLQYLEPVGKPDAKPGQPVFVWVQRELEHEKKQAGHLCFAMFTILK